MVRPQIKALEAREKQWLDMDTISLNQTHWWQFKKRKALSLCVARHQYAADMLWEVLNNHSMKWET
jgi:hypothetical protein